jgi:hypothetical protein
MTIDDLRVLVRACHEELDFALQCHEAWKPAAFDKDLHARVGHSFAAHTFVVIRQALRREMILTLSRIWDTPHRSLRVTDIANTLANKEFLVSLRFDERRKAACEVVSIVRKYEKGGESWDLLRQVKRIRNEFLAHNQKNRMPIDPDTMTDLDKKVEGFYQDTCRIVALLRYIVDRTHYDPNEFAEVYGTYSRLFWASVRGEGVEGHPNYRPNRPVIQ